MINQKSRYPATLEETIDDLNSELELQILDEIKEVHESELITHISTKLEP